MMAVTQGPGDGMVETLLCSKSNMGGSVRQVHDGQVRYAIVSRFCVQSDFLRADLYWQVQRNCLSEGVALRLYTLPVQKWTYSEWILAWRGSLYANDLAEEHCSE